MRRPAIITPLLYSRRGGMGTSNSSKVGGDGGRGGKL